METCWGSPGRNLLGGIIYMLIVILLATASYAAVGWSFGDAFYMVMLTVSSVGFDEVRPIDTDLLRTITITTILFGCTGMIFLTGALVQFITISQLQQVLGVKRMQSQIDALKNHVIICGFGRIGQMLARDLAAGGARFVILERSEDRLATAREAGYLCLHGDATDEEVLKAAGVMQAHTVATVLPDDAANVFITLSARSLNKSLEIIARGEAPSTERKLIHAGANRVVMPTHIGAERIAEFILYPETERIFRGSDRMRDFEKMLRTLGLELELVTVAEDGPYAGLAIAEIERRAAGAFFVVQLHRHNGDSLTRPSGETRVEPGDGLVLVGRNGAAAGFTAG